MKRNPRDAVAEARVARLATIDPSGTPNLVPFCFVLDGETMYFEVDRKPKTKTSLRRVENILERPDVTVLVDHYEEAWEKVWWVRLRGRGRVLSDGDEFNRAAALLREKYQQMRDDPAPPCVVAIDITQWRSWSYEPSYFL
ncbi:MAG: TIGR03668 family PPOX class F420-dependent oxidoreductase [Actinomycetota bacterium]